MTRQHLISHRRQAGFAIIEALIAFLVMAFGMLAIAGMQSTLSRSSDLAKQRSEAVRLAQQTIEQLRSFETVALDATRFDYTGDVVAGTSPDINGASGFTANTTFHRSWTVKRADGVTDAGGSDLEKWITVTVAWADRTSTADNHSVTLRSVIGRADPIELGSLFTGPGGTRTRTPKQRNVNIPYPAIALPGDKSSFKPPGAGDRNYVFDNVTGNVLGFCPDGVISEALDGDGTDDILTFDNPLTAAVETTTTACTSDAAFLLSGYIRFIDSLPGGTEANVDNGISNPTADITRDLTAFVDLSGTPPAATECFTERQKVVSVGSITSRNISSADRTGTTVTVTTTGNHGFDTGQYVSVNGVIPAGLDAVSAIVKLSNTTFSYSLSTTAPAPATGSNGLATLIQELTIRETDAAPTGYNSVKARFVAYTCIVRPYDHDGDGGTTPVAWSGQFYITPGTTLVPASWALGTVADATFGAANTKKVCRFTGDYKGDNKLSNSEHPRYYRGVSGVGSLSPSGALDNQNYLVVPFDMDCPTDDETNPLASDYVNVNTVLHQTQITTTDGFYFGGLPSDSAQWSSVTETANGSANLPMY